MPVAAAVDAFSPAVEVTRPGLCALDARGPSRYFGGERALAERIAAAIDEVLAPLGASCRVGVADGHFAALLAARRASSATVSVAVVAPGENAALLAPLPVAVLELPLLTDLLVRLGVRTLGELAALPAADVAARFGPEGEAAHRLACGLDDHPLRARPPERDMSASLELDPPADRVDVVAFAAKSMADRLCADLAGAGLVCTRIRIEAETDDGESCSRVWGCHRGFTPGRVAERVRWQLEGWLAHEGGHEDDTVRYMGGGLNLVRLVPEELALDGGCQQGFWGEAAENDERVARALARVQGLLGPEAVVTAVIGGGRAPADQVRLVPWGDPRAPAAGSISPVTATPWPGRLPSPSPSRVLPHPHPAELVGTDGRRVGVSGRGVPTSAPDRLSVAGQPWERLVAWAGPWPLDERWWDPVAHRRRARFQVVTAGAAAHLLSLAGGRWWLEASYD